MVFDREFGRRDKRCGLWLYSYEQVKSASAAHWYRSLALSTTLLMLGLAWLSIYFKERTFTLGSLLDPPVLIASALLAIAAIEMPAALTYFYLRYRGVEPTFFEDEQDAQNGASENNHGPNDR
jgi:hypothetical protein